MDSWIIILSMNKEITDYFNSKKRQLRSQSENGDEPKKQCDESSTIVNEVFKEGLGDPDCLAILINCLRNLEIRVNDIFTELSEAREDRIKGDVHLEKLNASISSINEKFLKYENEREEKEKIIENLQKNNTEMEKKIQNLEKKVDRQEQYSRRNCLLIHEVAESSNENTDEKVR